VAVCQSAVKVVVDVVVVVEVVEVVDVVLVVEVVVVVVWVQMQLQAVDILRSEADVVLHRDINVGNALVDVTTLAVKPLQKADPNAVFCFMLL
jgi:hypothetical protein